MIWVTKSQTIDPAASAAPDAPALRHGETERNPRPVPPVSNATDIATATTAPAKMAPHDTAEAGDSAPALS